MGRLYPNGVWKGCFPAAWGWFSGHPRCVPSYGVWMIAQPPPRSRDIHILHRLPQNPNSVSQPICFLVFLGLPRTRTTKLTHGSPGAHREIPRSGGAKILRWVARTRYNAVSPSRRAYLVSSATLRRPSLLMIWCRCVSTVFRLTCRRKAISLLLWPSEIN